MSFRDGRDEEYIVWDTKTGWDEWCSEWCFIRFPEVMECLADPKGPAVRAEGWMLLDERDREFGPALAQIQYLRERGLSSKQVIVDFVSHPAWEYAGPRDPSCLRVGKSSILDLDVQTEIMSRLSDGGNVAPLPPSVTPLCDDL